MTTTFVAGTMRVRLFGVRAHNQVMDEVHKTEMEHIKHDLMPNHFRTDAFSRYPGVFAKRTKKYSIFKARTVHHQRPNVFWGDLRQAVLEDSVTRSTATRGTFTAKSPMDSKIKTGPQAGKTIRRPLTAQRRLEIEHVSQAEIHEMMGRMGDHYVALMFDPRFTDSVLKQFR